ncbi:MAG: excinuclease ABC subunit UvrC [Alphaproteobacteria bacterium]|nr:excinuclease ABC subunit UvrC [Alphaproteobacteria bacterium]
MPVSIQQGLETLKKYIKIAPESPGVYRMLGDNDVILYVGKAKNIKKRITNYSHINKLPLRLQRMVSEIKRMEFIIVESEAKALLVENELIKKLEPRYNILLKDDKTFPHLVIDVHSEFPSLRKYRGTRKDGNRYFGPFANVLAVNHVQDILQKAFLLRSCRDTIFHNATRPCMQYQIKRCSAPCVGKISSEDYKKLVQDAINFLDGKNTSLQEELSRQMQVASDSMDYERAIVLRDRIRALTNIQNGTMVEYADIKSCDVIAVMRKLDVICIQVFFIRSGQNCGNVPYFPQQTEDMSNTDILEAFISHFYSEHLPPKEIIISENLPNKEFLETAIGTHINTYQKGNKLKLIARALENAEAAIDRKMALETSIKNNLLEIQRIFGLPKMPKRIEVYDNSHTQGTNSVGGMIVATPDGFDKNAYRKFNIKESDLQNQNRTDGKIINNDDFLMMKEVLIRRFKHMAPENRPDIILLDGGLGQLHAVHEALHDFDLEGIAIIAISKGPDRNAGKEFYHMLGKESFSLPYRSPVAFYMQTIRDEAHRFAIGTHRSRRGKSMTTSHLEEIEGIGAKRRRDLLNYFGSIAQIKEASLKDIQKITGISKKTAEKIYNYFHS